MIILNHALRHCKKKNPLNFRLQICLYTLGQPLLSTSINYTVKKTYIWMNWGFSENWAMQEKENLKTVMFWKVLKYMGHIMVYKHKALHSASFKKEAKYDKYYKKWREIFKYYCSHFNWQFYSHFSMVGGSSQILFTKFW